MKFLSDEKIRLNVFDAYTCQTTSLSETICQMSHNVSRSILTNSNLSFNIEALC